jgi:hypothetical protein
MKQNTIIQILIFIRKLEMTTLDMLNFKGEIQKANGKLIQMKRII